MTPEEKLLDQRYRRTFNWTLAEVDAMFALQGNRCACCGRLPGVNRLNVDHDHAFDRIRPVVTFYFELSTRKKVWQALALDFKGYAWCGFGYKRAEAVKNLRKILRRASVRGGLCLRCNKGFQMFEDSKVPMPPEERFDNAAKYFRDFKSKVGPDNVPKVQGVSDTLPVGGLVL